MSKTDMYARIKAAMPEDAEVVEFCDKYLAKADARKNRADMRLQIARKAVEKIDGEHTAKEIADFINENDMAGEGDAWTAPRAVYYLNKLAESGIVVKTDKGSKPNIYSVA